MNMGDARPRARAQTLRTRPGIEPGLGEPPRVVKASRATTPTVDADARANRSREGDVVCKLLPARVSRTRSCGELHRIQNMFFHAHAPLARPRPRSHWCCGANRQAFLSFRVGYGCCCSAPTPAAFRAATPLILRATHYEPEAASLYKCLPTVGMPS